MYGNKLIIGWSNVLHIHQFRTHLQKSQIEMYRKYAWQIMTTGSTTLHEITYAMNQCWDGLGGKTIQQRASIIHFDLHDMSNW